MHEFGEYGYLLVLGIVACVVWLLTRLGKTPNVIDWTGVEFYDVSSTHKIAYVTISWEIGSLSFNTDEAENLLNGQPALSLMENTFSLSQFKRSGELKKELEAVLRKHNVI